VRMRRLVTTLLLILGTGAAPAYAAPPAVELDLTAGYSTQDVLAAAGQLRLFGELGAGTRYFLEGAWAASAGRQTDAFGAAYPYDDGFYLMETYLEKSFRKGPYLGGVRLGRYRTPFGIYGRSEYAYNGFLRAPLIRYGDSYSLSNNWLEGGGSFFVGTPRLQLEASFGTPQDPLDRRRKGLDTVVRLQGYEGPFIVGASYIQTQPFQDPLSRKDGPASTASTRAGCRAASSSAGSGSTATRSTA
jgi:hypothetical protein